MTRIAGPLKSSVNAGQLSKSLYGKVNLKQYYSGAKRMKGIEPIPQAGFKLLPGSAYCGAGVASVCRQGVLNVDANRSYTLIVTAGSVAIWRNDRVKVATVAVVSITSAMVPDLQFYGEANTVGIFHPDLWNAVRLFRNPLDDTSWTVSTWPYGDLPEVDLGGVYTKTNDYWSLYLRWTSAAPSLVMNVSIDGNQTGAVRLLNGASVAIAPDVSVAADWHAMATALRTEIRALPGMNNDVDIQYDPAQDQSRYRTFNIVFTNSLSGSEYQVDAHVLNTSEVSVLASHIDIGKTLGEPLISVTRGGFSGSINYQDRQIYLAPNAKPAALAMSKTGEYFDLNIESQNDAGARLEALRTETSETILHVIDATYLVAFTDRGEYFASNRTIKRNEPLNWVRASTIGSRRSCRPVSLEGYVYFVSSDGGRLYRANYDAVSESFTPVPVNDLNGAADGDLVRNIKSISVQRKTGTMVSDRLWILRDDGRVVCGIANVSEDIRFAASEWTVAGGGIVHELSVDGQDQVWVSVERAGVHSVELLEEDIANLFQVALAVTTDLTGQASGLAIHNGRVVWALIDNDVFGPFTVSSGAIQTDVPSRPAKIGLWTAPIHESMPYVRVLANDDVVRRPGKVGSALFFLENTASIAIGANGRPAKDIPLNRGDDDLSQPKVNFNGHLKVAGLIGACMDPTLTITQVRPGRLHVRDYIPGVKL
ncbi:hypothetical protein [Rhizobium sp. PL01]|uniref:hypothetical protein n=1 Tax=Rhizobium sp. PL01 TaxID=3085631 RepID=UPI002981EF85|nr:hypothetical protein [Rhizobium sp. PL01]MDW5313727.1 hypothetical protein [Rhizobium sp. PL01]